LSFRDGRRPDPEARSPSPFHGGGTRATWILPRETGEVPAQPAEGAHIVATAPRWFRNRPPHVPSQPLRFSRASSQRTPSDRLMVITR
jgi:hypothetical protein